MSKAGSTLIPPSRCFGLKNRCQLQSVADIRTLDFHFKPQAEAFTDALRQNGVVATVTSARRTFSEQSRLYRAFLEGRSGGLPAAPPGYSTHEWGLAFDLGVADPRLLPILGSLWEKYGLGVW